MTENKKPPTLSCNKRAARLVRITTVPISIRLLITGQPAYMKEHGFDVVLVSSEGPDWSQMEDVSAYPVYKVNMARDIDFMNDLRSLWQLIRLFKKIKPDIVHSHTPKAGLLAMIAAGITGVPVRVHTLAGLRLMTCTGLKRKILYQAEKITFRFAHEIWPNSKKITALVSESRMLSNEKLHIILNGSSNGIELNRFSRASLQQDQLDTIREKYNMKEQDFCYLAIGRMVNDKGIEELVEAFISIYASYPDARLFLLGPFETADALPEEVQTKIMSHPAIVHIAWSNEVEYYMALCKCFVHASRREGFPNVVLQAGAMGIPVVCSDIPGNADIVESNEEGYIYPVKDVSALTSEMKSVMTDYDKALKKAAVLQNKVKRNYDRKAVHNAIKERYFELLKRKKIDVSGIN